MHAQVVAVGLHGRKLADEVEVDAKSGITPDTNETMGAGALAGRFLVSAVASAGLC